MTEGVEVGDGVTLAWEMGVSVLVVGRAGGRAVASFEVDVEGPEQETAPQA